MLFKSPPLPSPGTGGDAPWGPEGSPTSPLAPVIRSKGFVWLTSEVNRPVKYGRLKTIDSDASGSLELARLKVSCPLCNGHVGLLAKPRPTPQSRYPLVSFTRYAETDFFFQTPHACFSTRAVLGGEDEKERERERERRRGRGAGQRTPELLIKLLVAHHVSWISRSARPHVSKDTPSPGRG